MTVPYHHPNLPYPNQFQFRRYRGVRGKGRSERRVHERAEDAREVARSRGGHDPAGAGW